MLPSQLSALTRLIVVIWNFPGRVSPPPCVLWHFLALHEKGVRGKHCAVAHRHAVVDPGADPEGAAGPTSSSDARHAMRIASEALAVRRSSSR